AQPREKMYRLSDQKGLYLQVHPNGSKYWRYKYRVRQNGRLRETLLALGTYPEISLAIARERHWHAHQMRSEGRDPAAVRRQQRELERTQTGDTFRLTSIVDSFLSLTGEYTSSLGLRCRSGEEESIPLLSATSSSTDHFARFVLPDIVG
ncbi:MAG: Arm DNA-binding domain-containing protein, partial [Pseudomonadales bacterium]